MTLDQKIKLIDDLIGENPEVNISEYLFAVQEIEFIEISTPMPPRTGRPNLTEEQKAEVLVLAKTKFTAKEISEITGLTLDRVYKICSATGQSIRALRHPEVIAPADLPDVPVTGFKRPPAQYSNPRPYDTLQTKQKTA